ncbi:GrdX family protein [Schnuerera sp.]|uniref:GrdX family protein n=1 Tax=Schnuerera sp. TaxID=2794844 RepID=UPI002C186266|nr:GrdX family protein [Schnuerera sp.]HSH35796.1 GrdX family protein [Schnuerera sp.]
MKNIKNIIVTNNKYVYEKYKDDFEIFFDENFSYLDVLEYVRNRVHEGHKLMTHPLSGSVKPNETIYKTIIISHKKEVLDFDSLKLIEESITTAKKFIANKPTPNWPESILDDFRVIDLSLIDNAIDKII